MSFLHNCVNKIIYLCGIMFIKHLIHLVILLEPDNNMIIENYIKIHYDYIIVGSGTGGSMISGNINGDNILLIEAGDYSFSLLDTPILSPLLQKSVYDWEYVTVEQENGCYGLKKHQSLWPMGKIFGGTHMLNNMLHYHGDYNYDFNQYFHDNIGPFVNYDLQSVDEFLSPKQLIYKSDFADDFVKAGNLFNQDKFFIVNVTQDNNGKRYTGGHYIKEKKLNNLKILTRSLVTRIIFSKTNKNKAIGIEFINNNRNYRVYTKYGIILSAGVIGSPRLLQLSGIGNRNLLKKFNITERLNLPVGDNLQDHITTGFDLFLINKRIGIKNLLDLFTLENLQKYFHNNLDNPLTMVGCEALGFINTNDIEKMCDGFNRTKCNFKEQKKSNQQPDISYMLLPVSITTDYGLHLRHIINLNDDLWFNYFNKINKLDTVSIMPILLHPKSIGYVEIMSNNSLDLKMLIQPNYLQNPEDVNVLVKSIKILKLLLENEVMLKWNITLNENILPGCEDYLFNTDNYWICYIKHLTLTMYHPVGTCKMGYKYDVTTVVDHQFRVHNTKNLYIVDGSVLPTLPSGNPNAVISMLAQRFLRQLNYKNDLNI